MKDDLQHRRLPEIESTLKQEVSHLKKQLNINQRSDQLRYNSIWANLELSRKDNRMLKSQLEEIKARMEGIERNMGFYSGFEKHKY